MKTRTEIIAEAGVNHNGSIPMAFELIESAAAAGATVVKFQTFRAEKMISRFAQKAAYQLETTDADENQLEMVKKYELSEAMHFQLIAHCKKHGVEFLSTPFESDSADLLLQRFQLKRLKIPSGEITNAPFLAHLARTGVPLILSTGMATLGEVERALAILAFAMLHPSRTPGSEREILQAFGSEEGQELLRKRVSLLHCTTEYPAPFEDTNLRALKTLQQAFGLPVGFSDHTPGINMPIAAVALGATIIEKHFTLDRNLPGPDHQASLVPSELKAMIEGIRQVEAALGDGLKRPHPSELKNIAMARKSLVAATAIKKGEVFTEANLDIKRPGEGVSPFSYWDYLGKMADQNYQPDQPITMR